MRRFCDHVAVLTGAASGVGRAVALRLAGEGATIVGFDRDAARLTETEALVKAQGAVMASVVGDVGDRARCQGLIARAFEQFGRIDIVGNIAGFTRFEKVPEIDETAWRTTIDSMLTGPLWIAQAALPHLCDSGGVLINIASIAALRGQAYTLPYAVAKAGLAEMTRCLSLEYAKTSVRVVALAPGGIANTGISTGVQFPEGLDPQLMARYDALRGIASVDDIANVFAFLASREASRIHGTMVVVDGGESSW